MRDAVKLAVSCIETKNLIKHMQYCDRHTHAL